MSAALAGLALAIASIEGVRADDKRAVPQIPVTVDNPASNPALTSSIDDPGRIPYQSTQSPSCTGSFCVISFPAVPSGHRLVVQYVSGFLLFLATPSVVAVQVGSGVSIGTAISFFFAPISGVGSSFTQPVLVYIDAGQVPTVGVSAGSTTFFGETIISLTGYLLDCKTSPCAPIAQ
jgi:hypothetical protein